MSTTNSACLTIKYLMKGDILNPDKKPALSKLRIFFVLSRFVRIYGKKDQ